MTQTVLITGASGFLGGHLARALQDVGYRIATLSHRVTSIGDEWPAEVDYVVHAAGLAHIERPTPEDIARFFAANEGYTRDIARLCRERGVKKLIHISSIATLSLSQAELSELNEARSSFDSKNDTLMSSALVSRAVASRRAYALSKWAAEEAIREVLEGSACRYFNLRLPAVYGPGMRGNFPRLLRWIRTGVPLPFAGVTNQRSYLAVWNLADFVRHALMDSRLADVDVAIADREAFSTPALMRLLGQVIGKPVRLFTVDTEWLKRGARWLGRERDAERLLESARVDLAPLDAQCDWRAPLSAEEAWYKTLSSQDTHTLTRG